MLYMVQYLHLKVRIVPLIEGPRHWMLAAHFCKEVIATLQASTKEKNTYIYVHTLYNHDYYIFVLLFVLSL